MKRFARLFITVLFFSLFLPWARAEETLNWIDCVAEAQKNHPDLISATEGINEQKAGKAITASALYPQIDASLTAQTAKTTNTATSTSSTGDTYSYGVTGTQLLFDGLKTINEVRSASQNVKASQQGYKFTSSEVRLNLRTAFANLLKAQELIHVAEDIVKIRRDNLELITLRYQSGLEHRGALLTAQANLAQANFELSQAKRDVELAQRQLTKEMGRKEFRPMSVKGEFAVRDDVKQRPDLEQIAKNNPSVLQATANKNAAAFTLKSAYGNFSPQLSGEAGANKSDSHWAPRGNNWNAGLSLTMPIFEGGLRVAQVYQAQALYRQAEANERSIKDGIIVGLEQAWVDLQDALESLGVRGKTLEATQERSKIAEAQYSTGFIQFDNWIIIENDLVTAKRDYLNAQANILLVEAKWIQAKGETLEYAQ